jgi:hypothetical protein
MANATPEPANATTLVTNDPNDKWGHISPDADGSIAFHSEDEAKAYAKEKGVATGDNLVKIGTVHVLLDGKPSKSDK